MVGCCHLIMLVMINYCILFGLTDGTNLFFLNVFLFICFWLFLSFSGARSSVGQGLHLNWEFWTSLQGSQWPLVQKLNSRKKKKCSELAFGEQVFSFTAVHYWTSGMEITGKKQHFIGLKFWIMNVEEKKFSLFYCL